MANWLDEEARKSAEKAQLEERRLAFLRRVSAALPNAQAARIELDTYAPSMKLVLDAKAQNVGPAVSLGHDGKGRRGFHIRFENKAAKIEVSLNDAAPSLLDAPVEEWLTQARGELKAAIAEIEKLVGKL